MQLLLRLALGPPDGTPTESGELFESLVVALACDRDDLRDALDVLTDQQLLVCRPEQDDDERISITPSGAGQVHQWLPAQSHYSGSGRHRTQLLTTPLDDPRQAALTPPGLVELRLLLWVRVVGEQTRRADAPSATGQKPDATLDA